MECIRMRSCLRPAHSLLPVHTQRGCLRESSPRDNLRPVVWDWRVARGMLDKGHWLATELCHVTADALQAGFQIICLCTGRSCCHQWHARGSCGCLRWGHHSRPTICQHELYMSCLLQGPLQAQAGRPPAPMERQAPVGACIHTA